MSWKIVDDHPVTITGSTLKVLPGEMFNLYRKLNALYIPSGGGFDSGKHFFEVHFNMESGDVSVGVTSEKHFGSGYGMTGLMYHSNLSDNGSLLQGGFGPQIGLKDKVGILVDLTDTNLKVYVILNDRSLGLAFDIPPPFPKPLFPVVTVKDPGEVTITQSSAIPSLDYQPTVYHGIEGKWTTTGVPGVVNCSFSVQIEKSDQPDEYHASFSAGNHISGTLKKTDKGCSLSSGMSTMMLVTGEMANAENFVHSLSSTLKDVHTVGNDTLNLITTDGKTATFKRIVEVREPVKKTNSKFLP
eukprot:TRINITY_DN301_c0_g2_i1.p1 TRINITY_DN301_c0_g2~~TRINITY_DN301_c0_g2_i1.p1  ORF type:complete len:300 (+),score=55.22 TRINITY_DN301_c0_g2_i1:49-948(+)